MDDLTAEMEGAGGYAGGPLVDSVAEWLMTQALGETPMEALMEGCCQRLRAAGIPLLRTHLAFRTLHPLFSAVTMTWWRDGGLETAQIPHGLEDGSEWRRTTYYYMIENLIFLLRRRLTGAEALVDFPILEEFRDQGATDYLAYCVLFEPGRHGDRPLMGLIGSWLTDRPGGFSDGEVRSLIRIQRRLAVACKMTLKDQIARNILATYLGPDAGRRVLDGQIKRGDGDTVHAVVWYNDLRDSTTMADSLPGDAFLAILNTYFECTAGAVLAHGGEVLRFVGDAVLAIFPIAGAGEGEACAKALAAVREATERLAAVNRTRADEGAAPIAFGLGLHLGDVMFGNIGVPERLEFSVIGAAANEVARLEDLSKKLKCPVLASERVARHAPGQWVSAGRHQLQGVGEPLEVFALADDGGGER